MVKIPTQCRSYLFSEPQEQVPSHLLQCCSEGNLVLWQACSFGKVIWRAVWIVSWRIWIVWTISTVTWYIWNDLNILTTPQKNYPNSCPNNPIGSYKGSCLDHDFGSFDESFEDYQGPFGIAWKFTWNLDHLKSRLDGFSNFKAWYHKAKCSSLVAFHTNLVGFNLASKKLARYFKAVSKPSQSIFIHGCIAEGKDVAMQ